MYLLDANVFIQAKNLHYGFGFCPGFWDWIDRGNNSGRVFSITKVLDELRATEDELSQWAQRRRSELFLPPDEAVIDSLRALSNWANAGRYDQTGVATFLQAADYYLVAHAHAHGMTVVTHERPSDSTRKIKIPDACVGMGVEFVATSTMLRTERARLVLADEPDIA
jgi:predicted nucleic acid-binding protein